jgi:hypothetical protein
VIEILIIIFALIMGFMIGRDRAPVVIDDQVDEIERLKKQVEYYKDLCKWHIKDKERLSKK